MKDNDEYEEIPPFEIIDGVMHINVCCNAANDDWIRAARLVDGSAADKAKLERMLNTPMLRQKSEKPMHDFNLNCPAAIKGPFKIISLDVGSNKNFSGWLEISSQYRKYHVEEHEVAIEPPDRMKYRDLDHFAGVLGKFDPYACCLAEPIEIDKISHAALDKIKHLFPK